MTMKDGKAGMSVDSSILVELAATEKLGASTPRHTLPVSNAAPPGLPELQPLVRATSASSPRVLARQENPGLGMLWYATSSFFFAGMGMCSKALGNEGFPVWEITLVRAIVIMAICLWILHRDGDSPLGQRRGLLIVRGTLGYGSITCFFIACQLLPLADATTFTFLAPLIVACLSPLVLRERPSPATAVVLPLCITGVVLIAQPTFLFGGAASDIRALGLLFGLIQPFFSAFAKMTVRLLSQSEKLNVMVFYLMLCTLVYSSLGCLLTLDALIQPSTAYHWLLLIGQGLFGYGNQVCITKGLANARAASVMCMQYFSIVISELAGMLLFREFTNGWGLVGMLLVVASMVSFALWEARRKAAAATAFKP